MAIDEYLALLKYFLFIWMLLLQTNTFYLIVSTSVTLQ